MNKQAMATLLFVDDESNILSSLKRLFRPLGYKIHTATSGVEGLDLLARESVDLIVSDMRMPEMDGAEFLEKAAQHWPDTVRILLTGYSDIGSTIAAVNNGHIYRYVSKPWEEHELTLAVQQALKLKDLEDEKARLEALTHRQNEELTQLNTTLEKRVAARTEEVRQTMDFLEEAHSSLKKQYTTSVKIFANLIELRENTTVESAGHSRRVSEQVRQLGITMELPEDEVQDLFFAALLHDVGKIALPDALLNQSYNEMSNDERKEFEKHPALGQAALIALEPLHGAADLIRSHHEHVDGKGYPDQLCDEQIPLGARILSIVDDYNALLTGHLTGHLHTSLEARKFLLKECGRRYDEEIVERFIKLLESEKDEPSAEQCLKSNTLKESMVLTRDLIDQNGVLLLSKGHQLNDKLINKIEQLEKTFGYEFLFYVRPVPVTDSPRGKVCNIPS